MAGLTKGTQLIKICLILAISIGTAKTEITILPDSLYFNITTTPRIDLFIMHHQHQFALHLKSLEQQLQGFRENFHDRLEVVPHMIELVELKLQEMDKWLNPLMLLDDVNDYCVQKYRSKLPTFATVKTNLEGCKQKGITGYPGLANTPDVTVKNLRAYYTTTVANSIKDCKTKNTKSEAGYHSCVTLVFQNALQHGTTNSNTFQNQMKSAHCAGDMKLKEVFDCYSTHGFNTFKSIGDVMGRVENCISGEEFRSNCGDVETLNKGRCPYHMSWHLAKDDLTSEKVNNPFKGIEKSTPCLQINFITRGVPV